MKFALVLAACVMLVSSRAQAQSGTSVLFIGNSFTFGFGSPVRFYRAGTVDRSEQRRYRRCAGAVQVVHPAGRPGL